MIETHDVMLLDKNADEEKEDFKSHQHKQKKLKVKCSAAYKIIYFFASKGC